MQMRKAKEHRVEGIEREGHTHDRAKEFAPTKLINYILCVLYYFVRKLSFVLVGNNRCATLFVLYYFIELYMIHFVLFLLL